MLTCSKEAGSMVLDAFFSRRRHVFMRNTNSEIRTSHLCVKRMLIRRIQSRVTDGKSYLRSSFAITISRTLDWRHVLCAFTTFMDRSERTRAARKKRRLQSREKSHSLRTEARSKYGGMESRPVRSCTLTIAWRD